MSQVFKRGNVTPEMNMTPLIDVTFQLIIFFMLVNNIVAEQIVEMIPPTVDNPKTREMQSESTLIVNVAPVQFSFADRKENPLLTDGRARGVQIGSQFFALDDTTPITEAVKEELRKNPQIDVILRADAAIYYEDVQSVMAALATAFAEMKVSKDVNLVAYMPDKSGAEIAAATAAEVERRDN